MNNELAQMVQAAIGDKGKNNEKATVDLASALGKASLQSLHADLWPRARAVDQLATDARKLKEKGVKRPLCTPK